MCRVDLQLMLDGGTRSRAAARHLSIEYGLGGFSSSYRIGSSIGLPLIRVAWTANSPIELGPIMLLHNMRSFVCGQSNVWFALEPNPVAGGIGQ